MPCEKSLCSSRLNYFINSSLIHFTENELKFLTQWQRQQLSTLNWHLSVSSIHENILSFPISTLCCWLQKEPPSSFSAREQNSSLWSIYFQIATPTYQSIKCIITFLSGSKTRLTFAPCTFFPPQNKTAIFHTETCIWWRWVSKARSSHTRSHARMFMKLTNPFACDSLKHPSRDPLPAAQEDTWAALVSARWGRTRASRARTPPRSWRWSAGCPPRPPPPLLRSPQNRGQISTL